MSGTTPVRQLLPEREGPEVEPAEISGEYLCLRRRPGGEDPASGRHLVPQGTGRSFRAGVLIRRDALIVAGPTRTQDPRRLGE